MKVNEAMSTWGRWRGRGRRAGSVRWAGSRQGVALGCGLLLMVSWPGDGSSRAIGGGEVAVARSKTQSVLLQVEVDPKIPDADELVRWVSDDGHEVIAGLPDGVKRRGTVRVGIAGELYKYEVTVTAMRDGEPVGEPRAWRCECSNEELLQRLRGEVPMVAERLEVRKVEPERSEPPRGPVAEVDEEPRRARLGPAGVTGIVLMGMGVAGIASGAVLVAQGTGERVNLAEAGTLLKSNHATPGWSVLAAGGGLIAVGIVMLSMRRKDPRRRVDVAGVAPSWTSGTRRELGLVVSGRFGR